MSNPAEFLLIVGRAGTGKSTLVREMSLRDPGVVLTASTGIAAINLGGDCRTINSLLGYYDTKSLREVFSDGSLDSRLAKLSNVVGVTQIVTDEMSLIPAEQLDIICRAIDFHNKHSNNSIGWTIVGDFLQLPVVKEKHAFEAEEWPRFAANTTKLTKIYRQTDANFIEALGAARRGDGATTAKYFKDNFHNTIDLEYDGTTIVGTNKEVDNLNEYRLKKLSGVSIFFKTYRSGKSPSEWKNIPESLEVKMDALVMFLSNKYKLTYSDEDHELEYANGDLGHFKSKMADGAAYVKLLRNDEVVKVDYVERLNETVNKKGLKVTKGTIKYMPLRVAYSSTVYKAQGLTMDNVQINIRHPFFSRTPGMCYVALSRCRSSKGIRLVGNENLLIQRCTVNPKVLDWI